MAMRARRRQPIKTKRRGVGCGIADERRSAFQRLRKARVAVENRRDVATRERSVRSAPTANRSERAYSARTSDAGVILDSASSILMPSILTLAVRASEKLS